jgi:hypothetical protein
MVCFRSFNFLKALALGHSVLSSDCLQQSKDFGRWRSEEFRIWGDATLYQQVVEGRSWLKSADWWNQPRFSPCDSSMAHSQTRKPLLSDIKVVVLGADLKRRDTCWNAAPYQIAPPSLGVYQAENLLDSHSSTPNNLDSLSCNDVRCAGTSTWNNRKGLLILVLLVVPLDCNSVFHSRRRNIEIASWTNR